MIPEVANHLISSGGKRLRPMLTLAMAKLTGYEGTGHVKLAAAVEFMHPIMEKRRPLPAFALNTDAALLSAVGNDQDFSLAFVQQLKLLGRRGDIALGISTSGKAANVNRAMEAAQQMNLLTVGFTGRDGGKLATLCEHVFIVPSFSTHRIQEAHQMLVHILWDLIHMAGGAPDVI